MGVRHILLGVFPAWAGLLAAQRDAPPPLLKLSARERQDVQREDLLRLHRYRLGLEAAVAYVRSQPLLFAKGESDTPRLLSQRERATVRQTWAGMLDYYFALDSLQEYHDTFYLLRGADRRSASFAITYESFLAGYRYALELLDVVTGNVALDKLLDEAAPELGLPEGTYSRFKFRFLNVARATEFVAFQSLAKIYATDVAPAVKQRHEADAAVIWAMGKGRGEAMTADNALAVVKKAGFFVWFPLQVGVANLMRTKVWRRGKYLITPEQARSLAPRLEPGDVFFERREWHISNVGIPGFWPHVALYIGRPEERRAWLADDPGAATWIREQGEASGDIEALLRRRFPDAYATSLSKDAEGHDRRCIEAIAPGVTFTSLEFSTGDSLAVLRPSLPKRDRAEALVRAFSFSGRPYDYNFDFQTDRALVCSELICKSYEPSDDGEGLRLPIVEMAGRLVTPPNEIARDFDATHGTSRQQLAFVLFLDANERREQALESTEEEFRKSWKRPKWHILAPGPSN